MTLAPPTAGDVYKISNLAQGTRKEAHGDLSWRPHGVVLVSPDGLVNVVGRSSHMPDYKPRDLSSRAEPTIGLDLDGFFSMRWYKSSTTAVLADGTKAKYLGPLPEPQNSRFCAWTERN